MVEGSAKSYDAVIVGSGPNGLSAAIELARSGLSTLVVEATALAGGGARTMELTLPGFAHDVCSTVHPLGRESSFFRSLGLERHGLAWIDSDAPLVHVLDKSTAVVLERSLERTAEQLGPDRDAYRSLLDPIVDDFSALMDMALGPLRFPAAPLRFARFGWHALASISGLSRRHFSGRLAPALMAGIAAHAMVPLDARATAAFALVLAGAGHHVGWPIAKGGSRAITDALVACLRAHGGELVLGQTVRSMADLPRARAYLFDLTPKQLLAIEGTRLPAVYRRRLEHYRYGPGVFKMDWALDGPIPWGNPACARAATVHLSGDFADVARAEAAVVRAGYADRPFTLVVQPTLFDPTRAPAGKHIAWAYCHVANGSTRDMSTAIEQHIELYAPGFRDRILARASKDPRAMQEYNANYVGGDINGGVADLLQLFFRPVVSFDPYATPAPDVFLCSSSTPPGGGVHGLCGYWAARSVLLRRFPRVGSPEVLPDVASPNIVQA